ncbi:MAG: cupin domain-containing protein [Gracilibacteraceae bacterium]|jgi:quercetin dioxygenase-like cupin family protein|nr:cupin domain-containing protein [Gracilibacteraceae bacterium]
MEEKGNMLVTDYATAPHTLRPDGVEMTEFFAPAPGPPGGGKVTMGFAVFPPGMEAPPAVHGADEYAYILAGEVKARVGDRVFAARAGAATFIPAGEEHVSFNDSAAECRLLWMLVEK